MAQHEVPLELGALGRRDDDVLELADAGRDAVDRRRARGEPLHEAPPRDEPSRRRTRWSSEAMRISSKTESRLLVEPPSVPSAIRTPAERNSGMRVMPSPRNMLELGQ